MSIKSFLVSLSSRHSSRYKVSKCGRLRVDKHTGLLEPNWNDEHVKRRFSENTKKLQEGWGG